MDYENALYDQDGGLITGGDSTKRVAWLIEACTLVWNRLWTAGQYLALDEFSHKGARSRFCDIGIKIANKPTPFAVDWIMFADGEWNHPMGAHVFQGKGAPMEEIVFEKAWNPGWTDKGHAIATDSRYLSLIHI